MRTRTMIRRGLIALSIAGVASCDAEPAPPAVACEESVLTFERSQTEPCAFSDVAEFVVAHVLLPADPTVPASAYSNVPVTISRRSDLVVLCDRLGPRGCAQPSVTKLLTSTDENGLLEYAMDMDLAPLSPPTVEGTVTFEGLAAVETYSPGSSCSVNVRVALECKAATTGVSGL